MLDTLSQAQPTPGGGARPLAELGELSDKIRLVKKRRDSKTRRPLAPERKESKTAIK